MVRMPTIQLNRKRLKKVALIAGSILTVLVLLVVSACWFFGIRSRKDIVGYREMLRSNFHPVWKDLALRRFEKGDDLNDLIRKHPTPWREDYNASYTVLRYGKTPLSGGPIIASKDGKLIYAIIGNDCWEFTFFDTPAEEESLNKAYLAWTQQLKLEVLAYRIHLAIETGNDVFLAKVIERSWVKDDLGDPEEARKRAAAIYGTEAVGLYGVEALLTPYPRLQLTVEVTEVLHGDLTPGAKLTFFGDECSERDLAEPQTVFLYLPDSRMLFPFTEGGDLYLTVSRKVLDWYQSRTEAQIDDVKTRYLARQARYMQTQEQLGRLPPNARN